MFLIYLLHVFILPRFGQAQVLHFKTI